MSEKLNNRERGILKHALGWPSRYQYRNHFVTSNGTEDRSVCDALVKRGLMYRLRGYHRMSSGMIAYSATEKGKEILERDAVTLSQENARLRLCVDNGTDAQIDKAAECLPDGFSIEILIGKGEVDVRLIGADGKTIQRPRPVDYDFSLSGMVASLVEWITKGGGR